MFYVIFALICFVFCYALFLDNKNKIDISYNTKTSFADTDFKEYNDICFKADKKKYHLKSAFIGIFIENNSDKEIYTTRNYDIEINKDGEWYKLEIDNKFENFEKELKIKKKETFYQNIFIDSYKNMKEAQLRIVKKVKIDEEEVILKTEVCLHNHKNIREKISKNKKEK